MRLGRSQREWVVGHQDEVWFSRLATPHLHTWTPGKAMPLHLKRASRGDADPKALACYGLWREDTAEMMLRFVDKRPVSSVTTSFLHWVTTALARQGKKVLLMFWDNASWHVSAEVTAWIKAHNRRTKEEGGCRLLVYRLPVKSPWLNPIEPRWVHGKKNVVEPERILSAAELKHRLCLYYGCPLLEPIEQ